MRDLVFAANWKMHMGPHEAPHFMQAFLEQFEDQPDREVWFFPPAVSLECICKLSRESQGIRCGAQNVFWEEKGAYTGETSIAMVRQAGGDTGLVGHSERRHVFGETDDETAKKVAALLREDMTPVLCVGEKLEQRETGDTFAVVQRQLNALSGLEVRDLSRVVIAYEPVWAIGTGKTATPQDAADVHQGIRGWLASRGCDPKASKVLYGGSVKPGNIQSLIAEPEIDGVLVGGASLDMASWLEIVSAVRETPKLT